MGKFDRRVIFLEKFLRAAKCPLKELRCFVCDKPISGYELSHMPPGGYPKHEACSKVYNNQTCNVCKQFIPVGDVFLEHPWWYHKYCLVHASDGTPRCFSCRRLVAPSCGGVLKYGRKVCGDCEESAITSMESEEWHSLLANVHHFYRGLNMSFGQHLPLPLILVDAPSPTHPFGVSYFHDDTPTRRGGLKQIHILRGLPRVICGAVLAHEMMHAWLRLQGYPPLTGDVEEGICQVMAHMWLESESESESRIFDNNLSKFLRQVMAISPLVHGSGFRSAQHSIINYGLHATLARLRTTRTFPPNQICSCMFMHFLHRYYASIH